MQVAVVRCDILALHAAPVWVVETVARQKRHPFKAVGLVTSKVHLGHSEILSAGARSYWKIHLLDRVGGRGIKRGAVAAVEDEKPYIHAVKRSSAAPQVPDVQVIIV